MGDDPDALAAICKIGFPAQAIGGTKF